MKVRYVGTDNPASFVKGEVYGVIDVIDVVPRVPYYRITDELGDTALYPWCDFEIIDED